MDRSEKPMRSGQKSTAMTPVFGERVENGSLSRSVLDLVAPTHPAHQLGARTIPAWTLFQSRLARFGDSGAVGLCGQQGAIYGFTWPAASRPRKLDADLASAGGQRANAADGCLGESLPDWEVAFIGVR